MSKYSDRPKILLHQLKLLDEKPSMTFIQLIKELKKLNKCRSTEGSISEAALEGTTMCVWMADKVDITNNEQDVLQHYVANGGNVLLLLKHEDNICLHNTLEFIKGYGISSHQVVYSQNNSFPFKHPQMNVTAKVRHCNTNEQMISEDTLHSATYKNTLKLSLPHCLSLVLSKEAYPICCSSLITYPHNRPLIAASGVIHGGKLVVMGSAESLSDTSIYECDNIKFLHLIMQWLLEHQSICWLVEDSLKTYSSSSPIFCPDISELADTPKLCRCDVHVPPIRSYKELIVNDLYLFNVYALLTDGYTSTSEAAEAEL